MSQKMLSSMLRGVALALPVCFLLLLIASALLSAAADPDQLILPCAHAVCTIGAAISGWLAVRWNREQGVLCGGGAGLLFGLLLLLVGLVIGMQNVGIPLLLAGACLPIGALCGYLALPRGRNTNAIRKNALATLKKQTMKRR